MTLSTIFIFALVGMAAAFFTLMAGYIAITAPIAGPYLKAKLNKGMVIFLQTETGKRVMIATDKNYKNKQYGVFLPTEDSSFRLGNVPIALGHVDISVIPTLEACAAANKLDDEDSEVYLSLEDSAEAAVKRGIIDRHDARALYRYAANVTPNYVNSRIERKIAEILASRGNDIGKVFNYAIIFIMVMVWAGVAYSMISSGGTTALADSVSSTVSTMNV